MIMTEQIHITEFKPDGSYLAEFLLEKGYEPHLLLLHFLCLSLPPERLLYNQGTMVFLAFTYCFSNSSNVKPRSLGDGALGQFSVFSVLCVMFGLLVVSAREKGKPLKGAKVNMTAPELISQWHVCKLDNCPSLGTDMRSDYLIKGVHGIVRRSSSFNTGRIEHLYKNPQAHIEGNMKLHYGDLTDSTCLVKIINEVKPSEIYNLGAQSHVKMGGKHGEYVKILHFGTDLKRFD
ncbi:hypothetical protein TURU_104636 [Turdus rufiventris]|nr:hypothetical protein TURU_104636 [Turdus rufiventris]